MRRLHGRGVAFHVRIHTTVEIERPLLAVPAAPQDAEVLLPGTDGVLVLVRQNTRDLVQVGEVVHRPCGEQL